MLLTYFWSVVPTKLKVGRSQCAWKKKKKSVFVVRCVIIFDHNNKETGWKRRAQVFDRYHLLLLGERERWGDWDSSSSSSSSLSRLERGIDAAAAAAATATATTAAEGMVKSNSMNIYIDAPKSSLSSEYILPLCNVASINLRNRRRTRRRRRITRLYSLLYNTKSILFF